MSTLITSLADIMSSCMQISSKLTDALSGIDLRHLLWLFLGAILFAALLPEFAGP